MMNPAAEIVRLGEREPILLTLPQAARELAISKRTLERLIAAGTFPCPLKIGRSARVPSADIAQYLQGLLAQRGRDTSKQ